MMKRILASIVFLYLCACNTNPYRNTVCNLLNGTAQTVPFSKEHVYIVRGKVKNNLFLFEKGIITLADETSPDCSIFVSTSSPYAVNSIITINLVQQPIFVLNNETIMAYIEVK